MRYPPFDLLHCSWPRPVEQKDGYWTSEPEWDAPSLPLPPQPRWRTLCGETCWTIDWREFLDADRAFHSVTLEDSGNVILSGFYSSLRDRQMRMIRESAQRDPHRMTTIMDEHRSIAEALRDGDVQQVRHAVQNHLASTVRALGLAVEPPTHGGDGP